MEFVEGPALPDLQSPEQFPLQQDSLCRIGSGFLEKYRIVEFSHVEKSVFQAVKLLSVKI